MKKTLEFVVSINAPRDKVWKVMLGAETYKTWTVPFCQGSYFEGEWQKGETIKFLGPNGDGMIAKIADCRPPEFVSIQHLGEIKNGVEDTASEQVTRWAPAYENYIFAATEEGTELTVQLDTLPDFESYMMATFPNALSVLKDMCEAGE